MREIKFRIYHKTMGMSEPFGLFDIYSGRDEARVPDDIPFYKDEIEALMQYTGLKDKSNREIYEGDIIEFGKEGFGGGKSEVYWNKVLAMFGLIGCGWGDLIQGNVVGNVYENPELRPGARWKHI